MPGMKRTQFDIDVKVRDVLHAMAAAEGRTSANIVTDAILEYREGHHAALRASGPLASPPSTRAREARRSKRNDRAYGLASKLTPPAWLTGLVADGDAHFEPLGSKDRKGHYIAMRTLVDSFRKDHGHGLKFTISFGSDEGLQGHFVRLHSA